jgi:hypothetical protein
MATWAVFTTADEQHDDEQHEHDEGDEPKDLYPAWCAGRRFAVRPHAGVVAGLGIHGRVSHAHVLLCRAVATLSASAKFTRQSVDINSECLV